jgi:hypothetical protein
MLRFEKVIDSMIKEDEEAIALYDSIMQYRRSSYY